MKDKIIDFMVIKISIFLNVNFILINLVTNYIEILIVTPHLTSYILKILVF
jgi:hypothetical protein